ncbi:MAG: hypothetical protein J6V66_01960 [Clostridia bacterium]|nr:hypothetical protein [Clostridia bacterium]
MKKVLKLSTLLLTLIMALSIFTACKDADSNDMTKIYGTWSCTYTYGGNEYNHVYAFTDDFKVSYIGYKNGTMYDIGYSTFTIDGNDIWFQFDGDFGKTLFTYEDGVMTNSGRVYTKIK